MLTKNTFALCLAVLLIGMIATPAQARTVDPAEKAFKDQFGQEMREVRRTKPTDDDAAFAKRMFTEASSGKHDPGLTLVLYDKAYEYGLRDPSGYPTANQTLDKRLELDEENAFEIAEMRLALFEKWHEAQPDARGLDYEGFIDRSMQLCRESVEAGEMPQALKLLNRVSRFASIIESPRKNDVRDSISELVRMRKLLDEIEALQEQLGTEPTAADQLALIYLARLDDPATAITYADQMNDQELAAKIRLTTKAFELATPQEASETGAFYFSFVDGDIDSEPIAMLIRSRVWLIEYLSRERTDEQTEADAEGIKTANATLGKIDQALLKKGIGKKLRRKMSSLLRGKGQFDRPADVQAAIDKGVEWLYTQHNDDRHWEKDAASHRNYGGYTALVVYALLMADEDPRLNGDLSRAAHFMMNLEMKGTYAICFRIHAWEVLPHRERFRKNLMQDVNRLRRGSTKYGYWGYTMTGNDVKPGTRLDTSTTLAGGLGLWIGEEVGGMSATKIYWERLARGLLKYQLEDNGWSYNPAVQKTGQGAMTAGALALLYASYPHLTEETQKQADTAIANGMKWMDANFSPTTNVNRGGGFRCYYFAAVQHAGLFAGRRNFGEMDWYESISEHLVKSQAQTGSWGSVHETAFAIAFLCRGGIVYEPTESENAEPEAEASESENDAAESESQEVAPAPPSPE